MGKSGISRRKLIGGGVFASIWAAAGAVYFLEPGGSDNGDEPDGDSMDENSDGDDETSTYQDADIPEWANWLPIDHIPTDRAVTIASVEEASAALSEPEFAFSGIPDVAAEFGVDVADMSALITIPVDEDTQATVVTGNFDAAAIREERDPPEKQLSEYGGFEVIEQDDFQDIAFGSEGIIISHHTLDFIDTANGKRDSVASEDHDWRSVLAPLPDGFLTALSDGMIGDIDVPFEVKKTTGAFTQDGDEYQVSGYLLTESPDAAAEIVEDHSDTIIDAFDELAIPISDVTADDARVAVEGELEDLAEFFAESQ